MGAVQRHKIKAVPATAIPAPHHAPVAGRARYTTHSMGKSKTGETDENMPTRLACPFCKASKIKVMPSPMAMAALKNVLRKSASCSGALS